MQLSGKTYEILKWLVVIVMPALATALFAIGQIWEWENIGKVVGTLVALNTLLGAAIGVSTVQYNKSDQKYDGVALVQETPPGQDNVITDLNLKKTAEDVSNQKDLLLKVQNVPMAGG